MPEVPAAMVLELDVGDVVPDDAVGSKEPVAVGNVPLPVPVVPPNPVLKEYGYGGSVSLSTRG